MNLDLLRYDGIIREIDLVFARMIRRLDPGADTLVVVAAALVSRAANLGHVCLDLAELAGNGIQTADGQAPLKFDFSLGRWRKMLDASPLVGQTNETAPMILDGDRLYLQRYWKYEQQVARAILTRCRQSSEAFNIPSLQGDTTMDVQQQHAVRSALRRGFTVISGGPGTGKTYTIASIISRLRSASGEDLPRIKLAAPTGKAAARLQEALEAALTDLSALHPQHEASQSSINAQTVHRLLGAMTGKLRYRFNANNLLPADMVIIDEASMVDLALMARLMQALPPSAKLILVGDKDQLASVEAGAVLGDICSGLADSGACAGSTRNQDAGREGNHDKIEADTSPVIILGKNYRFGDDSGIHQLAMAVNGGDGNKALELLENSRKQDLEYLPTGKGFDLSKALAPVVKQALAPIFSTDDPMVALRYLMAHKILTPVRKGPFGVHGLNMLVERILRKDGVIQPLPGGSPWYAGRPVLITQNDYYHNLYNGDIGITTVKKVNGSFKIRVVFPDGQTGLTSLAPEQLPAHETVFAMTVHKSQGTEFDHVLLVLPDKVVPVLSRELIYTAITRARQGVAIWSEEKIFKTAIQRRINRSSGLRRALRSNK